MRKVNIVDCTLRDGGYCNNWNFGQRNINKIIDLIKKAGISIIEFGYVEDDCEKSVDSTLYPTFDAIECNDSTNSLVMIDFGKVAISNIPDCNNTIQGIRVAFHKKDRYSALEYCEKLKKKGYQVYVQPMVTNSYSEAEYFEMLEKVDKLNPKAFYVVDSFGSMTEKQIMHYATIADKNVKDSIVLGFHGHDNSKMAFSNARLFIESCVNHELYIDTSIMGMGRGAGNLATEVFAQYCNIHHEGKYNIDYLLRVIDEVITQFYNEKPWGYTLYYYLAARENCHPNYAQYLENKKTLTVFNMNEIFRKIELNKRSSYDKNYIETIYREYMSREYCDLQNEDIWRKEISNRNILLIAPGKSHYEQSEAIKEYIKEKRPVIIGVNFDFEQYDVKYVFLSNLRRYGLWIENSKNDNAKLIVTSNIPQDEYFMKIKYEELLSEENLVADNAGLMAIRFLIKSDVKGIALAGFDGYQVDENQNYASNEMKLGTNQDVKREMNVAISKELRKLEEKVTILFVTSSRYEQGE